MDGPSGVTQEEGRAVFLFFFTLYNCRCLVKSINITSRNSSNAILRVPMLLVVQTALFAICFCHPINAVWTSGYTYFGTIYMDEPSGVTQEEGDRIFIFFTLYNCRCLVKSINITSRNINANLRVSILLVVQQLNLHFM